MVSMEERIDWVHEMIERESTPEHLREETTRQFCEKRGIPESTYYYTRNKKENQEKIFEICLHLAKKYTPEIMENLGERAKGDNKAAEIFLEYVWKQKKRMDMTTNDKELPTPIMPLDS